jgi:PAS domain S-box-containing protein
VESLVNWAGRFSKWELWVAAALVAITALLVAGAGFYGERIEERRLRDLAITAASSLDAGDVTALARDSNYGEFAGKPEFNRVRAALARMRQSIPDARFIYLIAKPAGDWRFLADAEPATSKDYSPPGEIYEDSPAGFETVLRTDAPFVEPMTRDQWGVWVSGEAPVRDPATGKTVAVLGIDVDASNWVSRVWGYRWAGFGVAMLIVIIAALFAFGRRRQERNLRAIAAMEDRTRTIMRAATVGLVTIDEDGVIHSFNPEAERIFGYAEAEALGLNVSALMPEAEQAAHDGHIAHYLASGEGRIVGKGVREVLGRRKDGKVFPMELGVARMTTGGRTSFVGSIQDISERKAVEENLRQSQKMETLGQLTGGVAHDINNMLMSMQLNMQLVEDKVAHDPEAAECMAAALGALKRGAELTDRLLAFSRKQPLQPKVTNVNGLVGETLQLLQRTLQASVGVNTSLAAGTWSIEVDPGQLTNAIVNLAINARDAMPDGGTLTIETANIHVDDELAAQLDDLKPGDYVVITVSDTGMGMSRAVAERAFDPFFTTKPIGKGSGLGLSMVYGFVKQSGGHVKIYSEEGIGTAVKMFFPRTGAQALAQVRRVTPRPPGARGETILLVEDDMDVQVSITRILSAFGYRVTASSSGPDALKLIDGGLKPDLILADVVLPAGMNGPEVAEAVVERVPTCKTLFMSGYTDNFLIHEGRIDPGIVLLSKPFPRETVAAKIRQILDAPAA